MTPDPLTPKMSAADKVRAAEAVMDIASRAIVDAIYDEDGLDGLKGEAVLCLIAEWKKYGTHDVTKVEREDMFAILDLPVFDDEP